jgi:hypothetical protein
MPNLALKLDLTVQAIKALSGVETCSVDPSQVTPPGVVVQLVETSHDTMTGWSMLLNLILVVSDSDGGMGPATSLTTLLNAILTWAQPDGPVVARSVQLPSNPAPLPGLVFPLVVRTDA